MEAFALSSDSRLVRRVVAGDEHAFGELYERYRAPLQAYCRSIVRDEEDSHDALQSTMLKALAALRQGEGHDVALRPWLFRIAHNESVTILRRRRPSEPWSDEAAPAVAAVDRTLAQRERLSELVADLQQLSERQRGALVMRELSGMSYEEIGGVLDVSPAAARQSVFEARTALVEIGEGRDAACDAIRRSISDGDRRTVRARRVRAHLRSCDECRAFDTAVRSRRRDLSMLLPALPGGGLLAVLQGGLGIGAGGGATALTATKTVAVVAAVTAAAGGGAAELVPAVRHRVVHRTPASVTHVAVAHKAAAVPPKKSSPASAEVAAAPVAPAAVKPAVRAAKTHATTNAVSVPRDTTSTPAADEVGVPISDLPSGVQPDGLGRHRGEWAGSGRLRPVPTMPSVRIGHGRPWRAGWPADDGPASTDDGPSTTDDVSTPDSIPTGASIPAMTARPGRGFARDWSRPGRRWPSSQTTTQSAPATATDTTTSTAVTSTSDSSTTTPVPDPTAASAGTDEASAATSTTATAAPPPADTTTTADTTSAGSTATTADIGSTSSSTTP